MNKVLSSPITLFAGIIAGFLIAFFVKPLVPVLKPFATIYLNLLKMCVIPIGRTQTGRTPDTGHYAALDHGSHLWPGVVCGHRDGSKFPLQGLGGSEY